MSRRVRHTSGIAEEAQPAGLRAGLADSAASTWNATFHGLSAEDRARILALARPGGIIFAQQLPDPKSARKNDESPRNLFAPFLNGHAEQLQPTETRPIAYLDSKLDSWQKEAVAKSLATTDLFLLRGHPGSGKSRVLVEVVRQSIERGDRILFLSRHPAALDRVLLSLASVGEFLAIRCLHPAEADQQLRPEIRKSLLQDRISDLATRTRRAGQQDLESNRQERDSWVRAEASLPVLSSLLAQKAKLEADKHTFELRRTTLSHDLDALGASDEATIEDSEFAQTWSAWKAETAQKQASAEAAAQSLARTIAESKASLANLNAEAAQLNPLLLARSDGRFWTSNWWTAVLNPAKTERAAELGKLILAASTALEQQEKSLETARLERQRHDEQEILDKARLLEEERLRRERLLEAKADELERNSAELTRRWMEHCRNLPALANVANTTQEMIDRAGQGCAAGRDRADLAVLRAEQWLSVLDRHPHALRDALIEHTPLVAATASGWGADQGLTNLLANKPFDLLILEEADQFSEPECAAYARLARRWLFVGSNYLLDRELAAPNQAGPENRLPFTPPVFFGQLWQRLHSNPEHLPYSWVEDEGKLICRLRSILPEQRTWIETERLVDFPDIVLHILALPRSQPVVAEVVFPASFTIQKAKQFILQELQELAVNAPASSMRWQDDHSDRLVLQLAGQTCHHPATVPLGPGIREMLNPRGTSETNGSGGVAWQTCCIEFDRQSGWQRRTAEDWIQRHLGLRDLGRTLHLDGSHRYDEGLAGFVQSLLESQSNGLPPRRSAPDTKPNHTVQFVAVPLSNRTGSPEPSGNAMRIRPAGFELDLAEPKNRERLPADHRAGLPAQGVVNLQEAQAIVRQLVDWARADSLPKVPPGEKSVFVVATYEAQAELIRRLLHNTPAIAVHLHSIEIGVPSTFAHREAPWVVVSLTRSHSHRATAFGAGPKELLLALTRAREKMVVFGDVGALARRAHWDGTIERLDAIHADQERNLVRTLLAGFQEIAQSPMAPVGSEGLGK